MRHARHARQCVRVSVLLMLTAALVVCLCCVADARDDATRRAHTPPPRTGHRTSTRQGDAPHTHAGTGSQRAAPVRRLRDSLVPPPYTWQTLVRRVRAAKCTVFESPYPDDDDDDTLRAPSFAVPHARHALCRKPIVLLSLRDEDCDVCQQFLRELVDVYAAELQLLRQYATLVDVGSPMVDVLLRHPFPLPIMLPPTPPQRWQQQQHRDTTSMHDIEAAAAATTTTRTKLPSTVDDAAARRDAVRVADAYAARLARKQAHLLRRAFAGQKEYVVRAVFVYPHNGSVMTDIVNDDLASGTDAFVHFYAHAEPFLASVRAAIRVMQSLHDIATTSATSASPLTR